MSRREGIQRHRFIIHQLSKRPSSFEEIQDFLELQESLLEDKLTCSQRTLQRDIREIKTDYHIIIKNDRSRNLYYIADDGREEHSERLMETFDLYNAIRIGKSFGDHLLFENRKALGTGHMNGLLHAIRNRLQVEFTYEKFYDGSVTRRSVKPIAIKEARNRWYLIGEDKGVMKNFGLDRMSDLEILQKKFRPIQDFDVHKEFEHHFGIINGTGEEPQKIVLSFTTTEGRYINSLPLHHSQKEVLRNKKEHRFEYFLVPTYDFRMELLSYGNTVKVLEPKSLKKDVIRQLELALEGYR